ncbi:phytoene desaturase family protein [Chryseomicrobium sp. FSL W7-1435]|uniref:phytoene desaturase family protein n=1 Tax=Chryseomicrobium sp. FSL W7-1435 TaxID=2921704 RepID=UPI003159F246
MKRVAIIGAGLGGLSAAITLANAGYEVDVFEKNAHIGGKLMPVQLQTYGFDFGPNTITMPHVFKQVIEQTGRRAEEYLTFIPLKHHTTNYFSDGTSLVFSRNKEYMVEQLEKVDSLGAKNYYSLLKELTRLYELSETHFFPKTFRSWTDYLSPSLGYALTQVRPLESMDHFFKRYFTAPTVLQAFGRYATYIGSSPYQAPATFSMIAYLELIQGVYTVKGGTVCIARAFHKVAKELGVRFHLNTEVDNVTIQNKRITQLHSKGIWLWTGDEVVMNADLLKAYSELVEEKDRPSFTNKQIEKIEPSISAFVILAGLKVRLKNMNHHSVYFSQDYQAEFDALFTKQELAKDPTIYICNSSVTDRERSPDGDNLFILVNAPPLPKNGKESYNVNEYKEHIYDLLEKKGLAIRDHLVVERVIPPSEIAQRFGAFRGALYGLSSNRKQDAFLRPRNKSRDLNNLYFVGGSTHPGGGSPMVTMSGMNVANVILKKKS